MIVNQALAAAALQTVIGNGGETSITGFGNGEHQSVFPQDGHTHHTVALIEGDGLHASGGTAHGADVVFIEADGHTLAGSSQQLVVAAGQPHPAQSIAFIQINGDDAALSGGVECAEAGTLDDTAAGDHDQILVLFHALDTNHGGDLFIGGQGQQVGNIHSLAGTGTLRHFIGFQAVHPSQIGEVHHIVVVVEDEHFSGHVLFPAGHAADSTAAAALGVIGIHLLALYIAGFRQGQDTFLVGNQVFNIHFAADSCNLGAALIGVFLLHGQGFFLDDGQNPLFVGQNVQIIGDFHLQGFQLVLDFLALQTGELSQTHLDDCLSLYVIQTETLAQTGFCGGLVRGSANNGNHLVDEVHGDFQAFQNVFPFLCLPQLKTGAAGDNLFLEADIFLQHFNQGQGAGLAVHNGQHDDAESGLHLGIGVQLVQHDLGRGIPLHINDDVHTVAVGVVLHVGNAVHPLFLHQIGNALNEAGFVHLIGDFRDHNLEPAVFLFLNFRTGADGNPSPAGAIGSADTGAAHDNAAGGEVRPLDGFHHLVQGGVGVIDQAAHTVDDFSHVVGRNIGGHTHGDTGRTVDQQVGEVAGQYLGFLQPVVIVGAEIHRILVDIPQHIHRQLAHTGLGVTIGSRRVAVHGTEVAVTVHQHIPHGKILCQTHQRVINRRVTVGMVPAQHGADGIGALAVGLFRPQGILVHGVQDSSVHRLESVPHIGQSAGNNDGHGIGQEGVLHFLFQIHRYNMIFLLLLQIFSHFIHLADTFLQIFFSQSPFQERPDPFIFIHGQHTLGQKPHSPALVQQDDPLIFIYAPEFLIGNPFASVIGDKPDAVIIKFRMTGHHALDMGGKIPAGMTAHNIRHTEIIIQTNPHPQTDEEKIHHAVVVVGRIKIYPPQQRCQNQRHPQQAEKEQLCPTGFQLAGRKLKVGIIVSRNQIAVQNIRLFALHTQPPWSRKRTSCLQIPGQSSSLGLVPATIIA